MLEQAFSKLCIYTSVFPFQGDGKLAKSVENLVFSLDLVAFDETITACNMAHVSLWVILPKVATRFLGGHHTNNLDSYFKQTPLKTHSVDVTVFCLSLMGTDYSSFLTEAHRVLKSRFFSSTSKSLLHQSPTLLSWQKMCVIFQRHTAYSWSQESIWSE